MPVLNKLLNQYIERKMYLLLVFDVLIPLIWRDWVLSGQFVVLGIILIIMLLCIPLIFILALIVKIWPYVEPIFNWILEKLK